MSSLSSNGYQQAHETLDLSLTLAVNAGPTLPPPPPVFQACPNPNPNPNPNQMVTVPIIGYGYGRMLPAIPAMPMMPRYLPHRRSANPNSNFSAACSRGLAGPVVINGAMRAVVHPSLIIPPSGGSSTGAGHGALQLWAPALRGSSSNHDNGNQTNKAVAENQREEGTGHETVSSSSTGSSTSTKKKEKACGKRVKGTGKTDTLPIVSVQGTNVEGMLFKYRTKITIACCCHGNMFSPRAFILHAGGVPSSFPLRQITMEKNYR